MPGENPLFENGGEVLSPALRRYIKTIGKGIVVESMEIWKTLGLKDIELRIEGHTDPNWRNSTDPNEIYINNLELSSKRANNVYQFMLDSLDLNEEEKDFMKRNMISIGYSYSRRLREGTSDVKDSALDSASRRIEFRIISK
jgi:flagellar motor protein MotB